MSRRSLRISGKTPNAGSTNHSWCVSCRSSAGPISSRCCWRQCITTATPPRRCSVSAVPLPWHVVEERLCLLKRAGKGWPPLQPAEIRGDVVMAPGEGRHHQVDIEQRRRRGAVGHAEGFTAGPGSFRHLLVDDGECGLPRGFRLLDAEGVVLAGRADAVGDDLLHGNVNVEIE